MRHRLTIHAAIGVGLLGIPAHAQPVPSYGIDFATIGDPGNAPSFVPDPGGVSFTEGRGRVDYEFRIGRMEITTAQWMQFANAYAVRGGTFMTFARPAFWGGEVDPTYSGPGIQYRLRNLPGSGLFPVAGISWRECAQYCNWLHNGQATTLEAIANGAYDASTFTTNPNSTFNDQWTHHPDAKFWIPTLDEWIKAVHYDPNKSGPGQGGWWLYPHGSDTPLVYGPPGQGEANAGAFLPGPDIYRIPLGSYPASLTPWGLLDTAGATREWTEEVVFPSDPRERAQGGSGAQDPEGLSVLSDRVTRYNSRAPQIESTPGFRIASVVPPPSTIIVGLFAFVALCKRRRSP